MEWHGSAVRPHAVHGPEGQSGPAGEPLKNKASNLRDRATEQAQNFAREQKSAGSERVGSIARAVRSAGDQLEPDMPMAAGYVQAAANRLERISEDMRDRSVDDMLDRARDFAHRQPAVVFGGALVAGLLISRFLKSSARAGQTQRTGTTDDEFPRGGGHVH